MYGSGLNELMETVYASFIVTHILSGKDVARALKGHFFINHALHVFMFQLRHIPAAPEQCS